jgi:hypothetical protein
MVELENPTTLELREAMREFSEEVDEAEFDKVSNGKYQVNLGDSRMILLTEDDAGVLKLKAAGDTEIKDVSKIDSIELYAPRTTVYIDMIEFIL